VFIVDSNWEVMAIKIVSCLIRRDWSVDVKLPRPRDIAFVKGTLCFLRSIDAIDLDSADWSYRVLDSSYKFWSL
jgi:hypothetical protein